jgi:four helix bundle protein
MGNYKELFAYKKAYELAMQIFILTKEFPNEEKYALTNQIRRSSRSVCTNIVEAYRRRRYKEYFISKLNDSETENAETQVWLDFSKDCNYLSLKEYENLSSLNTEVGKLIWFMINNPNKFFQFQTTD